VRGVKKEEKEEEEEEIKKSLLSFVENTHIHKI